MSYAVGIMSGTSLDGIDVALVKITGETYELVDFQSYSFELGMKEKISRSLAKETSDVELICSLNFELAYLFGDAVLKICEHNKMNSSDLEFVASHGQTVYHHPKNANGLVSSTLQIGESSIIAEMTKTTVVSDFRPRDMAVGGQGAPIVPFSEYVMYRSQTSQRILQNIGGISNATIIPKNGALDKIVAFDCGPGNMIIDELCRHFYNEEYDRDGQYGSLGTVNEALLQDFMSHPFIAKPAPKTTGREEFGKQYVEEMLAKYPDISANDFIKTATLFTAKAISSAVTPYLELPTELIVGGGGSYNPVLIELLKEELPEVKVMIQEDIGLSSDAKEAVAMVVLGHRTINKLPSNVPSATGASRDVILGKVTYY
ncbi:anhydro-N-acetylmuramic acid kinase AnmK [Vagococcus fluvialis]|uniref:anhydro-N-acetylmuramic acid kinase AnmK n=1 Tax=Vagococcus fluvialis TaxID=2738 RepID=UPI001D09F1DF|nr:anhydro-N-acetylmuramic acid kinase AnmK [Vagococcus fluvialis]UDM78605.1 anhydro-N-acetylmuramic acid kinase [Vagococcus fluvialis]